MLDQPGNRDQEDPVEVPHQKVAVSFAKRPRKPSQIGTLKRVGADSTNSHHVASLPFLCRLGAQESHV